MPILLIFLLFRARFDEFDIAGDIKSHEIRPDLPCKTRMGLR